MTVDIDFVMEPDGNTLAQNYPTENGWVVDIYLKKLRARDNSNVEKLAQKINRLYLIEYLCAEMQQQIGKLDEERFCKVGVSTCVLEEVIKQM